MNTEATLTANKCAWISSTIGRKQVIGLTGLGLSFFVLTHMLGNMLILVSAQAYNEYSHSLISNPLIYVAEAGLVALFVGHFLLATGISFANRAARGSRYAVTANGEKGTSLVRRTLWAQGLLILAFTILHLISFKYGTHYTVDYGKGEIRDLHRLVIEIFQQPGYVAWYLISLLVLLFHLSHGVASSLQTFGIHHPRYQCGIKVAAWVYAILVGVGFMIQPIYVYFIYRG